MAFIKIDGGWGGESNKTADLTEKCLQQLYIINKNVSWRAVAPFKNLSLDNSVPFFYFASLYYTVLS